MPFEFECSILFFRYCFRFRLILGENKSIEKFMMALWTETTLSTFSKYKLICITQMNLDSFFNVGSVKCSGGKKSMICLTGMAAANVCNWEISFSTLLQNYQKPSLPQLKPVKQLDEGVVFFEERVKGLDRGLRVNMKIHHTSMV